MAEYRAIWPNGVVIRWRDLTWAEYKKARPARELLLPNLIDPHFAMGVYKACVIVGPDPSIVSAGIVQAIARHQVANNPFDEQYDSVAAALEYGRHKVKSSYLLAMRALISAAFHHTDAEMDSWTAEQFFVKLAQMEVVLGRRDPADPNAKPEGPKAPQFRVRDSGIPKQGTLTRPSSPSEVKGTIGDPSVPKNQQRGAIVENYTVTSNKYPPR